MLRMKREMNNFQKKMCIHKKLPLKIDLFACCVWRSRIVMLNMRRWAQFAVHTWVDNRSFSLWNCVGTRNLQIVIITISIRTWPICLLWDRRSRWRRSGCCWCRTSLRDNWGSCWWRSSGQWMRFGSQSCSSFRLVHCIISRVEKFPLLQLLLQKWTGRSSRKFTSCRQFAHKLLLLLFLWWQGSGRDFTTADGQLSGFSSHFDFLSFGKNCRKGQQSV